MTGRGLVPPGIAYLADNIISSQNILGASKEARAKWAKGLSFSEDTETLFFAGCGYQYTHQLDRLMSLIRKLDTSAVGADLPIRLANFQKRLGIDTLYGNVVGRGDSSGAQPLVDAVRVLQHLGVRFRYLGSDEPCCGGLLYYAGLQKEFALNAQKLAGKLKLCGVKRIISVVPSCTYTLRELIPHFVDGYDFEVKHFSEVVLELVSAKEMRFPGQIKVTYHDPCQMGRYLGLVKEPRRILTSIKGLELIEPEFTSGEWATCCGGGGGFEAVFPELSQILAINRAKELIETGAEAIVTQCPGCMMQLKTGLKKLGKGRTEVLDLAQIVAVGLGV